MLVKRRYGTWPVLVAGFGLLTALIAFLSFSALGDLTKIHARNSEIHFTYRQSNGALADIRSNTYQAAILIRDYLLAKGAFPAEDARSEVGGMRSTVDQRLAALERVCDPRGARVLADLRRELEEYWASMDPLLSSPDPDASKTSFLQTDVVPRKLAVLSLTRQIDRLTEANFRRERDRMAEVRATSVRSLQKSLLFALSLAIVVATFSVIRTYHLESRSERERRRAESAEEELRRLSQKLLHGQEEERKAISRELHDEIGQKLTALRMGIGRLDRTRSGPEGDYRAFLEETKALAETALRSVRDLAMGLRPSMLDDLGLGPALEWQGRQFSRHTGVPASVELEGDLELVPESVGTCAYRVAQEALTNCARHAGATAVRVAARAQAKRLLLTVEDDGVGFDSARTSNRGLGLIGMEERVRELGGKVVVRSARGQGATVEVEIPVPGEGST